MRWALGHMLQNSVYYTEAGGHIVVAAGLQDNNPDYLDVSFIDDGVGISEKDLPHVFERFYRGDPRDKSGKLVDPRGLGQGLFVAKTVAQLHGGYINVESEAGQGSMFTLTLPTMDN